jgi:hypothetical protein
MELLLLLLLLLLLQILTTVLLTANTILLLHMLRQQRQYSPSIYRQPDTRNGLCGPSKIVYCRQDVTVP